MGPSISKSGGSRHLLNVYKIHPNTMKLKKLSFHGFFNFEIFTSQNMFFIIVLNIKSETYF